MNRANHCSACQGGGLVPALGCTCDGNTHTCAPRICTVCMDSGRARCMTDREVISVMRQAFRLLVTGSRTWDEATVIEHALAAILARHPEGVVLVHGACLRGADAIAATYASRTPGFRIEAHPADWQRHGRAAGHLRNAEMITLGADGCVAFLRGTSPGTATVRMARTAGIPVWLHVQAVPGS